jgi:hypothetical protein
MKIGYLIASSFIILYFMSCEKKQHGRFIVSGFYYNNDSTPITNKAVYVFYRYSTYPLNLNNLSKDVGQSFTDSVGYFEFSCEYYKGGNYYFNNRSRSGNTFNARKGEHIHLDTMYRQ